jgi:single-strand DNA-binding protein
MEQTVNKTVNKVELNGYMGADPSVFQIGTNSKKAIVRMATNESFRNKAGDWEQRTSWHNVVMWGKLAEMADSDLRKGMRISVNGRLSYRKYTGKDGQERFVTEVIATEVEIVKAETKASA